MDRRRAQRASTPKDINRLALPSDPTTQSPPQTAGAPSRRTANSTGQPDLLIVSERRHFVRGCLTYWLDSSCGEFERLAIADVETSLGDDELTRATAVLIGVGAQERADGWLNRQIAWLRTKRTDLPIIMIVEPSETSVAEALAGQVAVQGYIPTSCSVKVAAAALRLVMAGGSYFPMLPDHHRAPPAMSIDPKRPSPNGENLAKLTPREEAVLSILGNGAQNKIIAYRLGMSLSTVKAHVHSIIRKFNVRNRTEAVVAARAVLAQSPRVQANVALDTPTEVPAVTSGTMRGAAYRPVWKEEPVAQQG